MVLGFALVIGFSIWLFIIDRKVRNLLHQMGESRQELASGSSLQRRWNYNCVRGVIPFSIAAWLFLLDLLAFSIWKTFFFSAHNRGIDILLGITSPVIVVGFTAWLLVTLFNWPRVVVPKKLRHERGLLS